MIPRSVTVLGLVAALLVCPFPCLSHSARFAAQMRPCCCDSCCHDSTQPSDRDSPPEPDAPRGTGMCLCHGAVIEQPASAPSPAAWIVSSLPLDGAESAGRASHLDGPRRAESAASQSCSADSGRHLCALIASFLL